MDGAASLSAKLVCVAQVVAAHGVRGAFKLRCFTEDPVNVAAYGPVMDEAGRELFRLEVIGRVKGGVIARTEGITDRDAAEALRGLALYVRRDRLPATEAETFYHEDLIGLAAESGGGEALGRVVAVHDFGAGEVLEISAGAGRSFMVAFTSAHVPVVDVEAGRIIVTPEALVEEAA